jgi:hypothetical protein
MATTTSAAIRDRMITVIRAIVPTSHAADLFVPYREERNQPFEQWAAENPILRRFSVRSTMAPPEVVVSNTTEEWREETFAVAVMYPHTHRYGDDGARDMDDIIEQDRIAIEDVIGLRGGANFTSATADATWSGSQPDVVRGEEVSFLVIPTTFGYWRAV